MADTLQKDERVLFRAHPSMFRNRPVWFCIWVTAFVIGWSQKTTWWIAILAGIVLSIWYLRCLMSTFTVTNKRTTLRTGILSKAINEVWHADVRNVQLSQSFMQRIFGVGTIGISSSGQSGVELTISGIGQPYKAKQVIDDCR